MSFVCNRLRRAVLSLSISKRTSPGRKKTKSGRTAFTMINFIA